MRCAKLTTTWYNEQAKRQWSRYWSVGNTASHTQLQRPPQEFICSALEWVLVSARSLRSTVARRSTRRHLESLQVSQALRIRALSCRTSSVCYSSSSSRIDTTQIKYDVRQIAVCPRRETASTCSRAICRILTRRRLIRRVRQIHRWLTAVSRWISSIRMRILRCLTMRLVQ